jgi:hypothetical protein
MIGRTVASNRRFAEFDDSIMIGPRHWKTSICLDTKTVPRLCSLLLFRSHSAPKETRSKHYPQHECLQSHFRSVTFLLSSHIWQQNFLPSVQIQEQLACPHFLGSGMAVSLRRNGCSIRVISKVSSCLCRRRFNAIARMEGWGFTADGKLRQQEGLISRAKGPFHTSLGWSAAASGSRSLPA